jgi:hypothetical protein
MIISHAIVNPFAFTIFLYQTFLTAAPAGETGRMASA